MNYFDAEICQIGVDLWPGPRIPEAVGDSIVAAAKKRCVDMVGSEEAEREPAFVLSVKDNGVGGDGLFLNVSLCDTRVSGDGVVTIKIEDEQFDVFCAAIEAIRRMRASQARTEAKARQERRKYRRMRRRRVSNNEP